MSALTGLFGAGGSGGGGTQVNQLSQWYVGGEVLYTDPLDQVWLKTGNVITSGFATYPDAYIRGGYLPTTAYASISKNVSSQQSQPTSVVWGNNGLRMYVAGLNSTVVYQYNLSTAYDVSSATFSTSRDFSDYSAQAWGISFTPNGTKCFVWGEAQILLQYSLSTPWAINTASIENSLSTSSASITYPFKIAFANNGTKFYVVGWNYSYVAEYTTSNAYSFSGATYVNRLSVATTGATLYVSEDGVYLIVNVGGKLQKYKMTTPYSIATAVFTGEQSNILTPGNPGDYSGGDFSIDLKKFITVDLYFGTVYQFNIGEAIGVPDEITPYDYLRIK